MCFPCSRSAARAPNRFIKGQFSLALPSMCFLCSEGYFSFVSHLSSTKMQWGLNLQKHSCSRYLKILCRKENCFPFNSTHYFFSSEGISLKRRQSTFFKVKISSPNLNQSLNPFQREASQHPSNLLEYRRVSRLRWRHEPSPHNQNSTRV